MRWMSRDLEQLQPPLKQLDNNNDIDNDANNNKIAYSNFVHSIKSDRTKVEYIKSLHHYINWLNDVDVNNNKSVITCAIKAAVRKSILIQIAKARAANTFH
jgi:hypothetical protein